MSISISVQLTTRCNFRCTHCFLDGSGDDLPLDTLERIIPFAKAHNCSHFDFTGGEPTIHPRFPEIVQTLAENGLAFTMITNGWDFADWYQNVKPSPDVIKRVFFSLDGATEDAHDLTRTEGSYRRVLQAVSICRYKNIPFGIRTTVTKRNIRRLEEITLLAAKLGAEELVLIPLQPTPRTADLEMLLSPGDLREVIEHISRLKKIFRMKITPSVGYYDPKPLALCPPMTTKQLFVTAKSEVGFCCHLNSYKGGTEDTDIIGSLNDMTLHEAHQRMIDAVAAFKKDKLRRLDEGNFGALDYFPCWYCLKYFKKVDWLAEFPESPWAGELRAAEPGGPLQDIALLQGE